MAAGGVPLTRGVVNNTVPCKTSGDPSSGPGSAQSYAVVLYADGIGQASTGTVTAIDPSGALNLPTQTWAAAYVVILANATLEYYLVSLLAAPATATIPGKIASGSGATYLVHLYPNGTDQPASPADPVTVKQLSINSSETIPADTWTLVSKGIKTNGSVFYTMQVPVYL